MRGLILASAFVLLGCGRSGGDPSDAVLGRLQAARDRACACRVLACAEAIEAKLETWKHAHRGHIAKMAAGSSAYHGRLAALADEITACTDRLRAADALDVETLPPEETTTVPVPEQPLPYAPGDVEPPPRIPTPAMRRPTSI